jgi:rubrerythrin
MPNLFINHYCCPACGTEWQDESPHTNNDRCPECDTETKPHESQDIRRRKNSKLLKKKD